MKIEKIDRVVLAVEDLEKGMDFFSDLLDIEFDMPGVSEEQKIRAVYSPLGIELVEPTEPDSPVKSFLEGNTNSIFAVVLKVPNLENAIEEMNKKDVRLVGKLEEGGLKEAIFHPADTLGSMIILCEYEDAMHPATIAVGKDKIMKLLE